MYTFSFQESPNEFHPVFSKNDSAIDEKTGTYDNRFHITTLDCQTPKNEIYKHTDNYPNKRHHYSPEPGSCDSRVTTTFA